MIISIVNNSKLPDLDVQTAIRAINRQIHEDFLPYWSMDARLRLEGRSEERPGIENPVDMRGDAVIYLWDEVNVEDALGYHDINHSGIPFGFVFLELAAELGEDWTVTLSHEALELIADPDANLLVKGPHPSDQGREVFHWFEMCDAVQSETYQIDGVSVSNFVLPLYFTLRNELGSRNDFLNMRDNGGTLSSFSVNRGGYVGFFDPVLGDHDQFFGDRNAERRMEIKSKARSARRAIRYAEPSVGPAVPPMLVESPTFECFAVRFADRSQHNQEVVRRILGKGWEISPYDNKHSTFHKVRNQFRQLTSAEAWHLAHQLGRDRHVTTAEPLFRFRMPNETDRSKAHAIRGSGLFGGGHKPGTEAPTWALDAMQVRQAWTSTGALIQGEGVRIAHPDTGYTDHPEVIRGGRVLASEGFDFESGDSDPKDDLVGGVLNFPGHGTGTASVMISDVGPKITGVAPKAKLIPLRVSTSVIHLSMTNVTEAILHAISRNADIISMSLGSPLPSEACHEAIQQAVAKGIIVLAAAGNEVIFVTFPAAHEEVIAVAASNIDSGTWRGSCRGRAVDISAPGESVWNASPRIGNGQIIFEEERSNGTSYAVAHVAGIAALWLERWRDELHSLAETHGREVIPLLFKEVLQTGGFIRPPGWRTDRFGVGIINAQKVLATPLPNPPLGGLGLRVAAPRARTGGLARLGHLIENDPSTNVESFLANLVGGPILDVDQFVNEFGAELAFHLVTSAPLFKALHNKESRSRADSSALSDAIEALRATASPALLAAITGRRPADRATGAHA